jgi:hypothetical protein
MTDGCQLLNIRGVLEHDQRLAGSACFIQESFLHNGQALSCHGVPRSLRQETDGGYISWQGSPPSWMPVLDEPASSMFL